MKGGISAGLRMFVRLNLHFCKLHLSRYEDKLFSKETACHSVDNRKKM